MFFFIHVYSYLIYIELNEQDLNPYLKKDGIFAYQTEGHQAPCWPPYIRVHCRASASLSEVWEKDCYLPFLCRVASSAFQAWHIGVET